MNRITASQLDRIAKCPASAVLPQGESDNQWEAAREYGNRAHGWMEHGIDARGEFSHIPRLDPKLGAIHEHTYYWDPVDDEYGVVKMENHREYDKYFPGHFIVGTADWVIVRDGVVYVKDLKTTSARPKVETRQLTFLGMASAEVYKCEEAWGGNVWYPRPKVGAKPTVPKKPEMLAQITGEMVDEVKAVVHRAWLAASLPDPSIMANPSFDTCRFCPCKAACGPYKKMVAAKYGQPVTERVDFDDEPVVDDREDF